MRQTISPSWCLTTPLTSHNNLFLLDDYSDNCFVRAYLCKCGKEEMVTGNEIHNKYTCPKCNNDMFYDVKEIKDDPESFIENLYYNRKVKLLFDVTYNVEVFKNKVQSVAKIKIPYKIDFLNKYIDKEELVIYSLPYNYRGKVSSRTPLSSIENQLQKLSLKKELFEDFIDIKLSKIEKKKKKQIEFILNHYNLKDLEFMKWTDTYFLNDESYNIESALESLTNGKSSKSIRRKIFDMYNHHISNKKKFNPNFICMVTSRFDDVNHISTLLDLDIDIDFSVLNGQELFDKFIEFMFTNYSQKQLVEYFKKINSGNQYLLRDTVWTFNDIQYVLRSNVPKINCSPVSIHNFFVELSFKVQYRHKSEIRFEYDELQLVNQVDIDKYNVRLPKNNFELYKWADHLNNCLASFVDKIHQNQTSVYGFFIGSELVFATEVNNDRIIQAHRKHNKNITFEERNVLLTWFEDSKSRLNKIEIK